jgi:hypothetical protein
VHEVKRRERGSKEFGILSLAVLREFREAMLAAGADGQEMTRALLSRCARSIASSSAYVAHGLRCCDADATDAMLYSYAAQILGVSSPCWGLTVQRPAPQQLPVRSMSRMSRAAAACTAISAAVPMQFTLSIPHRKSAARPTVLGISHERLSTPDAAGAGAEVFVWAVHINRDSHCSA